MNRAGFIAAIVAAQDSAATTPRVAADTTSHGNPAGLITAVEEASALGSAGDSRSSGSLGTSRPRTAAHKPATKEQPQ